MTDRALINKAKQEIDHFLEDEFEKYFGPGTREQRAARLDGAAVANPTNHSANELALGELLSDVLGYQLRLPGCNARWLLEKCNGDYDGLRTLITSLRMQGKLEWVQLKRKNVYSLRFSLAEEYAKERQVEEQHQAMNTSEGRRARYVTEGVLS